MKSAMPIHFFSLSAQIEVVKCPKDPREWKQVFEISPVGINEPILVELEMMCQCECEKPGGPVSLIYFIHNDPHQLSNKMAKEIKSILFIYLFIFIYIMFY